MQMVPKKHYFIIMMHLFDTQWECAVYLGYIFTFLDRMPTKSVSCHSIVLQNQIYGEVVAKRSQRKLL